MGLRALLCVSAWRQASATCCFLRAVPPAAATAASATGRCFVLLLLLLRLLLLLLMLPVLDLLQALVYEGTPGDEVEDLAALLAYVQAQHPGVEAVCSGAIASGERRAWSVQAKHPGVEAVCSGAITSGERRA